MFTWSVFEKSSLSSQKWNPVLETPSYQRYPRDNSRSKPCALNHRQKELHHKWGRSAGCRYRSDHIKPRSLSCVAKEVLFFIWVRVRWENHLRRYYYNGRTVVIFPYHKRWIELDTLKLVLLRWQQALFTFCAPWNPQTKPLKIARNENLHTLLHPFYALLAWYAM